MSANPKSLRWKAVPRHPHLTRDSAKRSRFARLMKVLLPLIAAILIAVVVGWPGAGGRDDGFLLAFVSRHDSEAAKPGMVNARYVGTDGHDRPFVISASRATPAADDPNRILLEGLHADLTLERGIRLALNARSGVYHRDLETLKLHGPISLTSDDGFEFNAESAVVDLARGTVDSDRPVAVQGPFGLLDAGAFRLVDQGKRLFFSGGVKLVALPATGE